MKYITVVTPFSDEDIAGVNFLDELPDKLQQSVLLMKEKKPSGATLEEAETLAR
jgi:hypothetical protein